MRSERSWVGWLGGLAMFVICVAPITLLVLADHGMRLRTGGEGAGFGFDYGEAIATAPGILSVALLAPLAGFKRRAALWWILPPVGLYYACLIGARVAVLTTPIPEPVRQPRPRRAEDLINEHLAR